MNQTGLKRDWGTFFLYTFGFILLWEWIRPLEKLTDTGNIGVFIFYILVSLVFSFFQLKLWISVPLRILYVLNCIYVFYYDGGFFSIQWMKLLVKDITSNVAFVMGGDWVELTNSFRTILFFLLLSLMTYLIHYWLLNRKKIFLFFIITLIYITVLDTFTPYSAKEAIIRTIVTGFAAMGILTLHRLLERERMSKDISFSQKWMTSLMVLIVCSVGIGYLAPKAEPIWPDPVPFIKSLNDKSGSVNTIGYGVDDSKLGGPFKGDNTVVFRYEAFNKGYWRVETKDQYTGKGWIVSANNSKRQVISSDQVPIHAYEGDVEVNEQSAIVTPYLQYPHIVYPFGVKTIESSNHYFFELDPITEKIYTQDNGEEVISNVSYTYQTPRYSVTKLQQVKSAEQSRLDPNFIDRYTQVPDTLPPEVAELALSITAGKDNWFDKAREIERYLKRTDYKYDQKNVAVPAEDEDYVAQFLFDTKIGYCDNFSTSMAVMLRSLGIPTRWVKGYSEGDYKLLAASGQRVYEVTNNNAHSWVEVYFPGSGWLAFEPTPGFTGTSSLNFDNYETGTETEETPVPEKKPEQAQDLSEKEKTKSTTATFSIKNLWLKMKSFIKAEWNWILLGAFILGLLAFIIYRKRSRWLPHYFLWLYKFRKTDDNYSKAYLVLLKQLERYGLKRKANQTLRDYAKYIDSFFSTREMSRLTKQYELLLYKGSLEEGTWINSKELWENLIKKTIA